MKIRIKSSIAGPFNAYHDGDEIDMPEATARKLIDRGIAEVIDDNADRQEAEEQKVVVAPETTAKRRPRKKRSNQ